MSPLPLSLVVLLALMAASQLVAATITTSMWYKTMVTQEQLAAAATSASFKASDGIVCAILAANTPWCHLLTHEGNTCVLYDVVVDSAAAAPAEATTTCKTRHHNVCIVEGVPLPHGATGPVQDCMPTTCWNRALIPTNTPSSTCSPPFIQDAMGCVYLHQEEKNWSEARQHCYSLEADLAVVQASQFDLLRDFVINNADGKDVLVGVKARKWLDGRAVAVAEWADSDPNGGEDECAHMCEARDYHLDDKLCTATYLFLCMRTA